MNFHPLLPLLILTVATATATDYPLLNTIAPAKAFVPTAANASLVWQQEADPANIASWTSGNTGIGYDTDTAGGGNYIPHIGINVQAAMLSTTTPAFAGNGSVFIRVPFTVNAAQRPLFKSLALRMRYDDGFVAWINGTRVTSSGNPATLAWNSLATAARNANLTGFDDFDITQHLGLLHDGVNMLAIQGLNATTGSSDLLIMPTLLATDLPQPRWPTPIFTEVPGIGARTRPVAIRNAADGSGKLYIVEQRGLISFLSGGVLTPFMDINARVRANTDGAGNAEGGNEEGLLGLAFPPGFAQSRRFYVTYNNFATTVATPSAPSVPAGSLVLSRFTTQAGNPALGDPASEQILLTIPHPTNTNHNGGDIHFAKDGLLYWGTGDGGGGGDTSNNAQNPNSLLGKMLRLNVEAHATGGSLIPATNPWAASTDGVADQIYHIGLRNPWRWSFDRLTGDLWIGDVGQDTSYEEIDFVADNPPGLNFQWRRREGLHDYNTTSPYAPGVLTDPILEKSGGDVSVTGGYVYRGRAFPRMNGMYFYGDHGSGNFYGVQKDGTGAWRVTTFPTAAASIATLGEDEAGELYWAGSSRVYRISDANSDSLYLSIASQSTTPAGRLTFTWGTASDRSYLPEVSTDMVTWTPAGPPQPGNATFRLTFSETADPPPGTGRRYFRAREL